MNPLIEMQNLTLTRPSCDASTAEVAAWYRSKAVFHRGIASRSTGAEKNRHQVLARQADARALAVSGVAA